MDFYDRKILAIIRDGKPRTFQQMLSEAGFSHNSLRRHLDELTNRGLVERLKTPRKAPGRPLLAYRLPGGVSERAVSALSNPSLGLVAVSFDGLRRVCKREKGGFCKEIRGRCAPLSCPLVEK